MTLSFLSSFLSHPVGARISFYPTIVWGFMMKSDKRRDYDVVYKNVLLGKIPTMRLADKLKWKENVNAVVSLNEPYETKWLSLTNEEWEALGISYLQLPTVDFDNAPTVHQINKGIKFIDDNVKRNQNVYVHCKAGRGRSTMLVLCYLVKIHKIPFHEAYSIVKEKRPHVLLGKLQWKKLKEFSDSIT